MSNDFLFNWILLAVLKITVIAVAFMTENDICSMLVQVAFPPSSELLVFL